MVMEYEFGVRQDNCKKIIAKRENFEKFPGPLKLKKTLDKYR